MSLAKVLLKKGRANPVWRGHPWVYSGAVQRTVGPCEPGDLVEVHDAEERLIGHGLFNPRSQIAVRMLTLGALPPAADVAEHALPPGLKAPPAEEARALSALIERRVHEAAALRRRLGLPSPEPGRETDAYRLVNAEGDGLPGVIIDRFGPVAAVQFTALGMKRNEAAVFSALRSLPEPFRPQGIVEAQGGSFAQVEGFSAQARVVSWSGDAASQAAVLDGKGGVPCVEGGVQLSVDVRGGQKTGMFLDQRDNRRLLGQLCRGARVLDVYSYAGGFALQALKHGAAEATCVDSSARALQLAQGHAERNQLGPLHTIEADAFRFLEGAAPLAYDVVVVDPPKFARAQKDLPAALKGYQRLNALALNTVVPGGLLASCSCSQLVDEESFERMLAAAALDAGRRITVLHRGSQGPDHPVPPAFPEGRYLKFLLLGVS
ncbi:MAG: class I SAM-dependent rRNA methyltransferase [Polyangia bacterium]